MKAAFLTSNGFEIRETATPAPSDDQISIQIQSVGVCSGDVFVYQNRAEMAAVYPRLGHEASGVIVAAGKNVTDFNIGDAVTTFGVPAYAEYLVTTPATTVKIPASIDPIYALGEPLACCMHAGWRFGTRPGDRVAIVGCGFMGLVCQQIARQQGADFILALDPIRERRTLAETLGANSSANPLETSAAALLEAFGPMDVVIEAAGNQPALDLCTPLVREHGRIILIGYHQSNQGLRTVNMEQWNLKAIDVVNGHVRREDEKLAAMQESMDWLARGQLVTRPLATTYPMDKIETAFQDLTSGKPGLLKAVLVSDDFPTL